MPLCPPDPIVAPTELTQWGVPAPFLAQFRLRPIEILISMGGGLGTMAIRWRAVGEDDWSADAVPSEDGATWAVDLDDAFAASSAATFAVLTFQPGAYVIDTSYTVSANGTVTRGAGAIVGVAAVRSYLPAKGCSAVTDEALQLLEDAVKVPMSAWPDSFRRHAAAMVHAFLKRSRGSTAKGAGDGDDVIYAAEAQGRDFFAHVGERGKPPGVVDSSPSADGPMLAAYPRSTDRRHWSDC